MADEKLVAMAVEILEDNISQKRDYRRHLEALARIYVTLETARESIPEFAGAVEKEKLGR